METYTWNSFTRRININAPVSSIYEMWSTPASIEKWFLRQCKITAENGENKTGNDPLSKGDRYLWRWHGWSDEVQEKGTILEANGKDEVKFTFGQLSGRIWYARSKYIWKLVRPFVN